MNTELRELHRQYVEDFEGLTPMSYEQWLEARCLALSRALDAAVKYDPYT